MSLNLAGKMILSNSEYRRLVPSELIPSRDLEHGWRWRARNADGQKAEPEQFPGARALRGEHVVPGIEMLYTLDEGSEMWGRVASVPIKDTDGNITGAFVTVSDIDESKRTAEALGESHERQAFLLALSDALRPTPQRYSGLPVVFWVSASE